MAFHYLYFRTRGVYLNIPVFRKVLQEAMDGEVAPMMKGHAADTTEGWAQPPYWEHGTSMDQRGIAVGIEPFGPGAQKWHWINSGVPGRWQQVARPMIAGYKPALRFYRYRPYSLPGGKFTGGGGYYGPPIFVSGYKRYWWPGIVGRNFSGYIISKSQPQFRRLMENAMRRAVRAAQREGK